MAIKEQEARKADSSLNSNAASLESPDEWKYKRTTFGTGLLKGLGITLRHLMSKAVTVQYPNEIDSPAPRSRGVIALKIENCTVCMLCARECPDWCIYIEGHKEARAPKEEGKRAKKFNVLDRFAIDYALCMYCGICVDVCPYDALFWSPEFEYSDRDIVELTHEMDRLAEWMYTVQPPPELDEGAEGPELKAAPAPPAAAATGPAQQAKDVGGPVPTVSDPGAMAGQAPTVTAPAAPSLGQPTGPAPAAQEQAPAVAGPAAAPMAPPTKREPPRPKYDPTRVRDAVLRAELKAGTDQKVAEKRADTAAARVREEAYIDAPAAGETMEATLREEGAGVAFPAAGGQGAGPAAAQAPEAPAAEAAQPPAAEQATEPAKAGTSPEEAAAIRAQVLQEEMNKGSDPRVAEARAKAAEMRALKGTTGPK